MNSNHISKVFFNWRLYFAFIIVAYSGFLYSGEFKDSLAPVSSTTKLIEAQKPPLEIKATNHQPIGKIGYFDDKERETVLKNPMDVARSWITFGFSQDGRIKAILSSMMGGYASFRDTALRRITKYDPAQRDSFGRHFFIHEKGRLDRYQITRQKKYLKKDYIRDLFKDMRKTELEFKSSVTREQLLALKDRGIHADFVKILLDAFDGDSWSAGYRPMNEKLDHFTSRLGEGYVITESERKGIFVEATAMVPLEGDCEVHRVKIKNNSDGSRTFDMTAVNYFANYDPVGEQNNEQRRGNTKAMEVGRHSNSEYIVNATEARNGFRNHVSGVISIGNKPSSFTTDQNGFTGGDYETHQRPRTVVEGQALDNVLVGDGSNISAQKFDITLRPGEEREFVFVVMYHEDSRSVLFTDDTEQVINKKPFEDLIDRFEKPNAFDSEMSKLKEYWNNQNSNIQGFTGHAAFDRMIRLTAFSSNVIFEMSRGASYFESGVGRGMGFRDSLQDIEAIIHLPKDRARQRLLDIAAIQFEDGSNFHAFQPLDNKGSEIVGGRFFDDPLWLPRAVSTYIKETGDYGILKEMVPFSIETDGKKTRNKVTLQEHIDLSFNHPWDHRGDHKLPLIGRADWNDCLNLNRADGTVSVVDIDMGKYGERFKRIFENVEEPYMTFKHGLSWDQIQKMLGEDADETVVKIVKEAFENQDNFNFQCGKQYKPIYETKAESVFIAQQFVFMGKEEVEKLRSMASRATEFGIDGNEYQQKADALEKRIQEMSKILNDEAWDGDHFIRAYDRDGKPLGKANISKDKISSKDLKDHEEVLLKVFKDLEGEKLIFRDDINSWNEDVAREISSLPEEVREMIKKALEEEARYWVEPAGFGLLSQVGKEDGYMEKIAKMVKARLLNPYGIALLSRPFTQFLSRIGEITAYPPGKKENGGNFTHNNMWVILGLMENDDVIPDAIDTAWSYFERISPQLFSVKDAERIKLHGIDAQAFCQVINSDSAEIPGKGKNHWLSGTNAWGVRVIQSFLGLTATWNGLKINPKLPTELINSAKKNNQDMRIVRKFRGAYLDITYKNPEHVQTGVKFILVNGRKIKGTVITDKMINSHKRRGDVIKVEIVMGAPEHSDISGTISRGVEKAQAA